MAPDDVTLLLKRFDELEEVVRLRFDALEARIKSVEIQQTDTSKATRRLEQASRRALVRAEAASDLAITVKAAAQAASHNGEIAAAIRKGAEDEREALRNRVRTIDKVFGSSIVKLGLGLLLASNFAAQVFNR